MSIKATARFFAIEENIIIPYTKEQVEKHCKELGAWGNRGSSSVLKEENISYTQIKIQNMQFKYPMYFEYIDAYCLNEEKETLEKIPTKFKTTHSFQTPIEYREQTWCYVGVFNKDISKENKIIKDKNKPVLYIFNFRNAYGDDRFYFLQVYNFVGFIDKNTPYLSKEEYIKSIQEEKHPFGKYKKTFEKTAKMIKMIQNQKGNE